jgi:hypothetical protein
VSVAPVIQHAKRMRCRVLSSAACQALPYFSTLYHKRYDFRKKVTKRKMCVLIFSTAFVWNISHSKKNSARYYHKCTQLFMWTTRYYSQILMKLEFSRQIFESTQISSNFMQILPGQWEPSSFRGRMDRQTDVGKLIVIFRNFAKSAKSCFGHKICFIVPYNVTNTCRCNKYLASQEECNGRRHAANKDKTCIPCSGGENWGK